MSVKAYVITDGSFDDELKIGGIAGKIVLEGQSETIDFNKPVINVQDSTEVEYLAIKEALSIVVGLKRKVSDVFFATDSLDFIAAVDPQQIRDHHPRAIPFIPEATRYRPMADVLRSIASSNNISFELIKVKAHVPDSEASFIEKVHNKVDFIAKKARRNLYKCLAPNKRRDGKYFSVIVPKGISEACFDKIERETLTLLRKGFLPRVLIEHGAKNPVRSAINQHCQSLGKAEELALLSAYDSTIAERKKTSYARPISGLDRVRARKWILDEGGEIDEWDLNGYEGVLRRDAIDLLLGQSLDMTKVISGGCKVASKKASEFMLVHGEEGLLQDHMDVCKRACEHYDIGIKSTLNLSSDPRRQMEDELSK